MVKKWIIITFINLFIAGILGFLLRIFQYYTIDFSYGNLVHTHSHIAILGWLYLIFFILIYLNFITKNKKNKTTYAIMFWITQISVLGMLISFPFQGYGFFSISFSTLHILCSYYFCWFTWKNLSGNSLDVLFLKTALFCMFLSTLGIWGIGLTIGIFGKTSILYLITVQFFLHFQINGWFFLVTLALILNWIKKYSYNIPPKIDIIFYVSVLGGIIFTFGYPLSWFISHLYIHIFYYLGIIFNIVFLVLFLKFIHPILTKTLKQTSLILHLLYYTFLVSFFLKNTLQLFLFSPEIAQYSHEIKNLTLGFIHLEVLGIYTSFSILLIIKYTKWINTKNILILPAVVIYIIFFILSESLLFIQGILIYFEKSPIPYYFKIISWGSILFPLGIGLLVFSLIKNQKDYKIQIH